MTPRGAVATQIAKSGYVKGWPQALSEGAAMVRELRVAGYLIVSEADLATVLHDVWAAGSDEELTHVFKPHPRLAGRLFAALGAAQEKGEAGS